MTGFKTIEKLGLEVRTIAGCKVIFASEIENLLQSAQVVYGTNEYRPDEYEWSKTKLNTDTHSALLIGITPIKKKTKAEAALELLERLAKDHDKLIQPEWHVKEAKRILEMKDEV